jgi:DNA-binding beta-propeller fold protein YncE
LLVFVALLLVLMPKWRARPYRTMARGYLAGGAAIFALFVIDGTVLRIDQVWGDKPCTDYDRVFHKSGFLPSYCEPIQSLAGSALAVGAVAGAVLIVAGVVLQRFKWRTKILMASGIAGSIVATMVVASLIVNLVDGRGAGSRPVSAEVPLTGLNGPIGVAVDASRNVYVVDSGNNRVLELAARSTTPNQLPFTGFTDPINVAVDSTGSPIYVSGNHQVWELATDSSSQAELPFGYLTNPTGVAVTDPGHVYVIDGNRVFELQRR